jgi:hypothetical protein
MKAIRFTKSYWKELLVIATPVIVLLVVIMYNIITIGASTNGLMTY